MSFQMYNDVIGGCVEGQKIALSSMHNLGTNLGASVMSMHYYSYNEVSTEGIMNDDKMSV